MAVEEREAVVQGRRASYGFRAGRGYPVLLVHGLHGSWRYWRPFMEALPPTYEVYAPDLPGYGRSEPMPSYQAWEQVGWLNAFCESVMFGSGAVVGHSIGGVIALGFLRQVPERVDRLVTVSAPVDDAGVLLPLRMLGWPFIGAPMFWAVRGGFASWLGWARLTHGDPELIGMLHWAARAGSRAVRGTVIGWQELTPVEREALFGPPLVPTLVLHGDQDRIVPPSHAERMAAALPGAQFAWLKGAGHMPVLQVAEKTATAVAEFLGR